MQATPPHVSPYGGSWYPDDPAELTGLLNALFEKSRRRTGAYLAPQALGFVVPHAGLVYSGGVAAAVYRNLEALQPDTLVLLGFPHRGAARGAWLPRVEAYRTALGEIEVDREAVQELLDSGEFRALPESKLCDHSVEIQLPLLQRASPKTRIVPVYVSDLDTAGRLAAAGVLARWMRPGRVLVASSDFTHYGASFSYQPFPADEWVSERLRDLDNAAIQAAGSLDAGWFLQTLDETGSTVCGREPVALLMATLQLLDGEDEIFQELLDYQTSGELTGDFRHSVSYAALGFFRHSAFHLGEKEGELLLESARRTLCHYQQTGERIPLFPERVPALDRRAAAFVSLHKAGELRGCVGRHSAIEPLAELIPELALSAALEDTRFEPLSRSENNIEVEISVLSPLKRVRGPESFQAGRHGLYLDGKHGRALLLPQVATERNWSEAEFLQALARKAGVSQSIYRMPSTKLSVFRAQILR